MPARRRRVKKNSWFLSCEHSAIGALTCKICRGFTLVELLVVISIIGVLSTLVLANFNAARERARDTQRKSDLKQYQNAYEVIANKYNGIYPSRGGATASNATVTTFCGTDLASVISQCPQDPKYPTTQYLYHSNGSANGVIDATQFALWATLETEPNTYWVVCSNGNTGKAPSTTTFVNGVCPNNLTP